MNCNASEPQAGFGGDLLSPALSQTESAAHKPNADGSLKSRTGGGRLTSSQEEGRKEADEPQQRSRGTKRAKRKRIEKQKERAQETVPCKEQQGRWTSDEHERFLKALDKHGNLWIEISRCVGTRTPMQVRSHAQKHCLKLRLKDIQNVKRDPSRKGYFFAITRLYRNRRPAPDHLIEFSEMNIIPTPISTPPLAPNPSSVPPSRPVLAPTSPKADAPPVVRNPPEPELTQQQSVPPMMMAESNAGVAEQQNYGERWAVPVAGVPCVGFLVPAYWTFIPTPTVRNYLNTAL